MLQSKLMISLKLNLLILALFFLVTYPAYSALLHPGMLTSHDGEGHIIRMFEFNKAIEDGHFPVRWSKRLNWGLGYPYFTFNYPLTYYFTYLLNKSGLNLLGAFKSILLLSFPLGGFLTYLWLKQHFSKLASFLGGLFYVLIPYHFVNVYVRGNMAETLSLTIVPLGLYLVNLLSKKPNLRTTLLLSLSLSSIILTHNLTALLFLPVIFIYGLLLSLNKVYLKFLFAAFILPILFTCFFWLPVFLTKQFITIDRTFPLYNAKHFPKFGELLYSPWGYGGSKTGAGQMSPQVGLLHLSLLFISLVTFLVRSRELPEKRLTGFFLSLTLLIFFMMTSFSKPVWDTLTPLKYIQFPWRLLSILALTISFLAAFSFSVFFKFIPQKAAILVTIILIFGLLFFNRNHWRANEYYPLPDYWFLDQAASTTTTVDGEHTPIWQLEDMPNETSRYEVISGEAKVNSLIWKTNYHKFAVDASLDSKILDRTVYFPGWTVFLDGKMVERIDQNNPETKGLIGFETLTGEHLVEVRLLEPLSYKIANSISLISLISALLLLSQSSIKMKLR